MRLVVYWRWLLSIAISVIITSIALGAEGVRIVSIDAGKIILFEDGKPDGPAYHYVKGLLEKSGHTIEDWTEIPLVRGNKEIDKGRFDIMIPYLTNMKSKDVTYISLGTFRFYMFSKVALDAQEEIVIAARHGSLPFYENSPTFKGKKITFIPLSGKNLLVRLNQMLQEGKVDGYIVVQEHLKEIKGMSPKIVSTDLHSSVDIGMGVFSSKVNIEKLKQAQKEMGQLEEFVHKTFRRPR